MLEYKIQGQGPALFLLHGFLEDGSIWEPLVAELRHTYRCIQIDFPGYGSHGRAEFPERLEPLAAALEDLRQDLFLDEFSIMGHSMGVYIGLSWLDLSEIKPRAFVGVNASVYPDSPERLLERKRSLSLVSRHKDAYIKMALKGLFLPEQLRLYTREIEDLTTRALQCPSAALMRSIQAMSTRKNHKKTLSAFNGEKYLIAGDKDPLFPISFIRDMARETGADLYTYSGSHMGWLEAPELILRVLGSERIPSASD